jgi:hypothetical protein
MPLNVKNLTSSPATQAAMKKEIDKINKDLRGLLDLFDKKGKKEILNPAANILVNAARDNVPESNEPHYRYSTAKLVKGIRAPKGKGNIVAVYSPGNLKKSIRRLTFRKSSAVFVGPKLSKRSKFGEFGKGNRVDGYYAHWMEFGSAHFGGIGFMRRAYESKKGVIFAKIRSGAKAKIVKYGNTKFGKFSGAA